VVAKSQNEQEVLPLLFVYVFSQSHYSTRRSTLLIIQRNTYHKIISTGDVNFLATLTVDLKALKISGG